MTRLADVVVADTGDRELKTEDGRGFTFHG